MKADSQYRAAKTDVIGEDQDWSADKLYRHLCLLENIVPRKVSMTSIRGAFFKLYEIE